MKTTHEPLVPREQFVALYRKLRFWWGMRQIEEGAYILGLHVLAKMVKLDSLEVAATWVEFCNEVVVRGDDVVCGPTDPTRFLYLGALQQLHSTVGILSHISQDGMEEAKREARDNRGISHHFTKAPGPESDLLGPDTPMLFVCLPWAGYGVDETWKQFLEGGRKVYLPAWVSGKGKAKG